MPRGIYARTWSVETRQKYSEALKQAYVQGYGLGAAEVQQRRCESIRKGFAEGRRSPWNKGKSLSLETREKISQAGKGRRRTPETRARLSESLKKAYAEGQRHSWNKGKKYSYPDKTYKREAESPSWKGGREKTTGGYICVWARGHPNANASGRILEHRLIMANHLGRPLAAWEKIHHRNGVRSDNRLENLELVTNAMHRGKIICPFCRKQFSIH